MRYAPFLKEHGRIGFVAPSFGCNIEPYRTAFDHALECFRDMGYETVLGPNCYAGIGIGISNTPKACGDELMEYYLSEANDVLISCGGGEMMCEVLNYLDFDVLKQADPKWYMGYSDNTNMTFLLATLADTASIYGPCAAAFGMEPWHASIQDAFDMLHGRRLTVQSYDMWEKESLKDEMHPLEPYHVTEPNVLRLFMPAGEENGVSVNISGRLIGGCMDCLVNLLGTKFDGMQAFQERYAGDGFIWFLEACDLNVMAIRRAVWQMKNAGWFRYVKGFLIGRPLVHGQELMGLDQYHAVTDLLSEYNVPIVMDLDIGHIAPMMPVICGSMADVTVNKNSIRLAMRCD